MGWLYLQATCEMIPGYYQSIEPVGTLLDVCIQQVLVSGWFGFSKSQNIAVPGADVVAGETHLEARIASPDL